MTVSATSVLTHPITRFVARRLVYSAVVMFGVLVVVFALVMNAVDERRIHQATEQGVGK